MRLRGRFTFWFCVAALVPIAAAAIATREVLSASMREKLERRRGYAEALLRLQIGELEDHVQRTVEAITSREHPHPYASGALVDLVSYQGQLPAAARRRIGQEGITFMRANGLDVLSLSLDDGEVVDAPHYRPAEGEYDREALARSRAAPGIYYQFTEVMRDGAIEKILVASSARSVADGPYRVHVVGGRAIDAGLLSTVRAEDSVDARILGATGEVLVEPGRPWRQADISIPLTAPDGETVAAIEVNVLDDEAGLLSDVTLLSASLGAAALVGTLLLAFFVARRMTRDLDELVEGTQAAARGDLDHEVKVRSRDEIGEVAEAFNAMLEDLRDSKERLVMAERVAAWQEIARRLAHEIKNPLTPIQMSVETLRRTWGKNHPSFGEIFEESTATVLEEADRLRRIVSEFSEFARMPKPEKTAVDLNELVQSQLALYQGSIAIDRDLQPGLPAVEADRDSFSQVILNLLENARDATRGVDQPRIAVTTRLTRGGRGVELTIEDNGTGIATDSKERLFTPYFTTKHAEGGTGLGLAIVHRIVTDHGGRIVAGDGALGGARFSIELPVEGAELSASRTARVTRSGLRSQKSGG